MAATAASRRAQGLGFKVSGFRFFDLSAPVGAKIRITILVNPCVFNTVNTESDSERTGILGKTGQPALRLEVSG